MTYKTILFSLAFIFSGLVLSAQPDTALYFVKSGNLCDKEFADAYRKVKLLDKAKQRYSYEEYFLDGTLKSKGYYLYNGFWNKTGTYTEYYKNGKKQSQGTYLSDGKKIVGEKVNTWFYGYENGKVQSEKLYALDKKTKLFNGFLINYWDTTGKKIVTDGNGEYSYKQICIVEGNIAVEITFSASIRYGKYDGVLKGFYADGTLFCEETYAKGELVEGKSYGRNGKAYTYNKIYTAPEFNGGDKELTKFLQENLKYPLQERDENKDGKAVASIKVDSVGKVKEVKIIRSASANFDKEVLRVVNMLPDFKPCIQRGQPVGTNYFIPVIYKLPY